MTSEFAMRKICYLCIVLLCFLASCSEEEKKDSLVAADYTVKGKVEKGPFISGSTITLQPLDTKMNPLGTTYSEVIRDDEGTFDLGTLKLDAPYASLTANGYFYNEIDGELSKGELTLQAIVDLKDNSTVNVNLLTHLTKERVKRLIADGASFEAANKQAQKELLTNFGLQKYAGTDVAKFSITAGTDEAAALLVVSASMLRDRSEAQLTEYLAKLSLSFAANGKFTDEQKAEYRKSSVGLNYPTIASNVKKRYKELGKDVTVKDLLRFVDYDGNGIAGDEFGDPNTPIELAFEKDVLEVPKEGGTFKVIIRANVPYSLTYPFDDDIIEVESSNTLFKLSPVVYDKQLNEQTKELTIVVNPAKSMLMKSSVLKLYSMDGKVRSELTIQQKGDPAKSEDLLREDCLNYLRGVYEQMSNAINYLHSIEGLYTKPFQPFYGNEGWGAFQTSPVSSSNNELQQAWAYCYKAINLTFYLDEEVAKSTDLSFLLSYTACIRAAIYYEMAVLWENVVYLDKRVSLGETQFLTSSSSVFEKMAVRLQDRSHFVDKKNSFSSLQNMLFISKDVPTALLAKMYLYQKDYAKAYSLFKEIIDNNHYQLDRSRDAALSRESKEMVYGVMRQFGYENVSSNIILGLHDEYLSFVTYTEVMLSAAECAWKLGNRSAADSYLANVLNRIGTSPTGDISRDLKYAWSHDLKGTGTYFAFLKRNGMAKSELGLSKDYMLILPIPYRELMSCPGLVQNPGY